MNLPEHCIRRPIATTLLWLAIMIVGAVAYTKLPIAALPSFDQPTISVNANLPGASPETMASSVATVLERQFSTIAGLRDMSSTSRLGSTSITLEFDPARDIDSAALDVQAALLRANRQLPRDMTSPPSYRKVNPADDPIIFISISSPSLSLDQINSLADNLVSPTLSTLPGVAQVTINGQKRYAVRVSVNPEKLSARDMTLAELASSLRSANSNAPIGTFEGTRQVLVLSSNSQLTDAAQFAEHIVAIKNGMPVRLADVADVEDSVENIRSGSWFNGERGINLSVLRQPDANTVAVVDAIRAAIPRLQAQMPASVELRLINDRSLAIREAIHDVSLTMLLTIALVVLVILLFLRRMSATLIPSLSVPASLLATFGIMLWAGFSLNNISLMGLTIAIGLVVDDAIVVLENIVRHIENGIKPFQAAIRGAREVAFTVVSISISLVAVFIPIFFLPGTVGLMFHEFAWVVSIAIVASAVVSLTLIPMLGARFIKHHDPHAVPPLWSRGFERGFNSVLHVYQRMLDWTLHRRGLMLLLALATCVATVLLYQRLPKGFFPEEDLGQVRVSVEGAQDIAWPAMRDLHLQVESKLRKHAAVEAVVSFSGGGNRSVLFLTLKPRGERPKMEPLLNDLRREVSRIAGVTVSFSAVQNLRIGGRGSSSRFQYTLQSVSYELLAEWSDRLQRDMADSPLLREVRTDAERRGLQARLLIDRERMLNLGVDMQSLRDALGAAYSDREVATIYQPQDTFPVIMHLSPAARADENALQQLRVRNKSGQLVPVSAFTRVERTAVNTAVYHQGQLPAVTLSFNLAEGVTLSQGTAEVEKLAAALRMPPGVFGSFYGDAAVFEDSQTSQLWLILMALAVIYVVLGVLYESWVHPITILAGIPSAAIGAFLSLELVGLELSFIAMIGILLLVGIVKKNAIMMIDFALEAERKEGRSPREAIREACVLRFRPIMMTTLAAIMGALPIALGVGAGAELRQPLGVAVVGGLIFSQMVTLFITPALYLGFDWLQHKLGIQQKAHA